MKRVKLLSALLIIVFLLGAYVLAEKSSATLLNPFGCDGRTVWATEYILNPQVIICKFQNGLNVNQAPREIKFASEGEPFLTRHRLVDIKIFENYSPICFCLPVNLFLFFPL